MGWCFSYKYLGIETHPMPFGYVFLSSLVSAAGHKWEQQAMQLVRESIAEGKQTDYPTNDQRLVNVESTYLDAAAALGYAQRLQ